MKVLPGEENAADDAIHGAYEQFYSIKAGDVVLDIGAHVGYFTTLAAEKVGPTGMVYAFEPHPGNFKRLSDNAVDLPIRCINAAAWDRNGHLPLYTSKDNSGGHSMIVFEGYDEMIHSTTIDLGWWCIMQQVVPQFVKIDAECSELKILQSLLRTELRPAMALEIHTDELYRECRAFLKSKGYVVFPDAPVCRRSLMFANLPDDIGVL